MRRHLIFLGLAPLLLVVVAATPAVSQDDIQSRMQAWSKALGVECSHCHAPDRWTDTSKPTYAFAQRMMRMVDGLNVGLLADLGGVTCWTCHRGQTRPARLPRALWEGIQTEHASDFVTQPERALAMSVYSASLGVSCSHCHDTGNWASRANAPHAMVARMLPIFDAIPAYFDTSRMPQTQCDMCHQGKTKPER